MADDEHWTCVTVTTPQGAKRYVQWALLDLIAI
jgi:hypothetical protein